MVDGELNFITKLDKTGFEKGKSAINNGIGNLKSSLKSLAKVAAVAFSVKMIYDYAKASKEAYNTQIEQETKLTTIMKQRMGATDAQIDSVKQLAAEQQKLGVIGDEVQLAGAQQVATFLNETDSIKTLLPAMNDLLAQQNGLNASESDAVNIGNLMGKVMQGQTSALKRVGISFSEAEEQVLKYGSESEKAAMLAEVITNNVGHMNQELAKTDAGKQKQLANTMGDIKEQFGQAVSQIQTAFLPVLSRLVNWFSKAASVAQSFSSAIRSAFGVETDNNSATVATTTATAAADAADSYEDMAESAEKTKKAQENSLASFDKVIKIGKQESESGSSSSGGGGGTKGGTSVTTLPKSTKAISWADELKQAIKKGDWESVGATFADKINKVFGKVNWENVRTKVVGGAKKISDGINGFVTRFNWKGLGNTLGEGITTVFSAAYEFLKNTKWREIGSGFATFLNGLMEKTDFKKIGATLGAKLNAIIGLAFGFVTTFNFAEAGLGLSDIINGWFGEVDWEQLGDTLGGMLDGMITLAFNFVDNLDFKKMASNIATAFNRTIKRIDFKKLGQTVSKAFKGVWDFIATALEEIDWAQVGKSISEFINGIDWWGILKSLFNVIGGVLKAAPEFLLGIVENLDFANAAGAFALLFAPKLASKLLSKITGDDGVIGTLKKAGSSLAGKVSSGASEKAEGIGSAFGGKFAKGLGTAGAVIGAAIIGWQIGTKIYEAAKPGIDKITDALLDLQYKAEEISQTTEADQSAKTLQMMNKFKSVGIDWVKRENIEKYDKVYAKALSIYGLMQKYPQLAAAGYTGKDIANNQQLYEDLQKGKLPTNLPKSTSSSSSSTPVVNNAQDAAKVQKQLANAQIEKTWREKAEKQAQKEAYNKGITGPSWTTYVNSRKEEIYNRWKNAKTIPFLATGTVVPANFGRFAAILGDNKREPEVVSPLSTMKQAVLEALALQGNQKQPVTINISLDTRNGKRLLSKEVIDDINDIIDSTGRVPIKINV